MFDALGRQFQFFFRGGGGGGGGGGSSIFGHSVPGMGGPEF